MAKRFKLSKRRSRKTWNKGRKVNKKNHRRYLMRGGFRL